MTKLKTFAVTALAAATIAVGGLVAAPTASAAAMTCNEALATAYKYEYLGNVLYAMGNAAAATFWYGRAAGLIEAAC